MNTILKELRNAQAGLEGDETYVAERPYAGHAFENELTEVDDIMATFELEAGCEGYAILNSAAILSAGTEEDGSLNLADIEDFGMEAVAEKVKQAGYKGKAYAKKMVDALIGFIKNIINVMFNKNIALKKFGKLVKKYKEKLIKVQFSGKEKDADKEITIRDFTKLHKLIGDAKTLLKSDIQTEITDIKGAKNWKTFIGFLKSALAKVSGLEKSSFATPAAIGAVVTDKKVEEKFDKIIEGYEVDTKSVSLHEAKSSLVAVANKIEKLLEEDVKIQDQLRKFVVEVNKKRDKLYKEADKETESMSDENLIVNKAAVVVTKAQAGYTKLFKHTSNALNAFLTDMHKVISAGK